MIITIILLIISLFLDNIIPNLLKNMTLFLTFIVIMLSAINLKENKCVLWIIIFSGLLYDLLYTRFLILHMSVFFAFYYVSLNINLKNHILIKTYLIYLLYIFLYVFIMSVVTSYSGDYIKVINHVINGLLIDTIYFLLVYLIYFVRNWLFSNRYKNAHILVK